jgi:hypothetical protein
VGSFQQELYPLTTSNAGPVGKLKATKNAARKPFPSLSIMIVSKGKWVYQQYE